MAKHTSATAREEEPHILQQAGTNTIVNALKRRAQAVLNDTSIDPKSRAIIRYALETNDPWLARLVRHADAGDGTFETFDFDETPDENDSSEAKIESLAEIICQAGNESAGALLVLMGTLENSTHPKALANTVKHFAFTHCGELNLYGMVDAQIAMVESEILSTNTLGS